MLTLGNYAIASSYAEVLAESDDKRRNIYIRIFSLKLYRVRATSSICIAPVGEGGFSKRLRFDGLRPNASLNDEARSGTGCVENDIFLCDWSTPSRRLRGA